MPLRFPRPLPPYLVLALLFATSGLTWGIWIARIPGIAGQLELSRTELGAVLPAFSVGALISFPIAAAATGRFGTRASVRMFGILRGLTFPLLALAPNPITLLAALGVSGFMHGGLDVSLTLRASRSNGGPMVPSSPARTARSASARWWGRLARDSLRRLACRCPRSSSPQPRWC